MKLDKLRISSLECSRRNHRQRLKSLENRLDAAGEEFKTANALIGDIRPLVEAITRDFEAHDRRLVALESFKLCGNSQGDVPNIEQRLAALEASEVNLREHCQGNVPMSVFNALAERVEALELKPKMSLAEEAEAFLAGFRAGRK